jgi:hypothetical protein
MLGGLRRGGLRPSFFFSGLILWGRTCVLAKECCQDLATLIVCEEVLLVQLSAQGNGTKCLITTFNETNVS